MKRYKILWILKEFKKIKLIYLVNNKLKKNTVQKEIQILIMIFMITIL